MDRTISSKPRLGKKSRICIAILLFLVPFLNNFVADTLFSYNARGNFLYAGYEVVFSSIIGFVNIISTFSAYALVIYGIFSFERPGRHITAYVISAASVLVQYAGSLACAMITSSTDYTLYYVLYMLGSFLLAAAILFAVHLLTLALKAIYNRRRVSCEGSSTPSVSRYINLSIITASLVFLITGFIQEISETVSDITLYGAPQTLSEYVYLISPYAELLLYAFAGYFVCAAVMSLLRHDTAAE